MADININEYVRLKNGKIIRFEKFGIYRTHTRKIDGKYERGTFENKCIISGRCHYRYDNIVKHSKNIIDLIEVGDYVNGLLITAIYDEYKNDGCIKFETNYEGRYRYYIDEDIKSIVTKEQFKKIEYGV